MVACCGVDARITLALAVGVTDTVAAPIVAGWTAVGGVVATVLR